MKITLLTLFPAYFAGGVFECSIIKKAIDKGIVEVECVDIRSFATGRHQVVDDRPYGGGPGMVMKAEPVVKAIRSVRGPDSHVIYLTPQGETLRAEKSEQIAKAHSHIILLCGHYEGIDERAIELEVDEELSIGDYVVTSGNVAALVVTESVVRFVPGVVGHPEGAIDDTFHTESGFEGPLYTRPQCFEGIEVPPVLLQGNHAEITRWRQEKGRIKQQRRKKVCTH